MSRIEVKLEPLTRAAFAPFGDVIEKVGAATFETNQGTAVRYHDLARIDLAGSEGRTLVSIFEATVAAELPFRLRLLERHPISSQAFVPLGETSFVVVVAPGGNQPDLGCIRAFMTAGRQGINFHPATWHHPLIALQRADFLVIDRDGPGPGFDQDYEEVLLNTENVFVCGS
jgi:ureidoglycolate lyase